MRLLRRCGERDPRVWVMGLGLGEALSLVLVYYQGPPRLLDQILLTNAHVAYQATPLFEVQVSV